MILNPAVDRSFNRFNAMTHNNFLGLFDLHLLGEFATGQDCTIFAAHDCVATP